MAGIKPVVLISVLSAFSAAILSLAASYPSWWVMRGVVTTADGTVTNDFAPATAGQLKWIATQARDELNDHLPDGSGFDVDMMVNTFGGVDNYAAVNIGQVKTVAVPFYDRLIAIGYTDKYPWAGSTAPVNDFAPANIGQVKNLFSFDVATDTDGDGMPDWWERTHGLDPNSNDASLDPDGDGLDNLHEYLAGGDPHKWSTAGDSFSDGWKNAGGLGLNTSYAAGTLAACGLSYAELQALGANADARLVDDAVIDTKCQVTTREKFTHAPEFRLESDTAVRPTKYYLHEREESSTDFWTERDMSLAIPYYRYDEKTGDGPGWPCSYGRVINWAWFDIYQWTGMWGNSYSHWWDCDGPETEGDNPLQPDVVLTDPPDGWIYNPVQPGVSRYPDDDDSEFDVLTDEDSSTLNSYYDDWQHLGFFIKRSQEHTTAALIDETLQSLDQCDAMDSMDWNGTSEFTPIQPYAGVGTTSQSGDRRTAAKRELNQDEYRLTLQRIRYQVRVPGSEDGVVYRAIVMHRFFPQNGGAYRVEATKTFIGVGTGDDLILTEDPGGAQEVSVAPPDENGEVRVEIGRIHIENPTDANNNGIVDDLSRNGGRGNVFAFDITDEHVCTIPVAVTIVPDTVEMRAQLAGHVRATLEQIQDQGDGAPAPVLTWDDDAKDPADPSGSTGLLTHNEQTGHWEATARCVGLPEAPPNSYGRVPKKLHELLHGSKTLTITVTDPAEFQCVRKVPYEVYYGESLQIGNNSPTPIADTTYNYDHYIKDLVAAGGDIGMEAYEKMNCSTEAFQFDTLDKARENFIMRHYIVTHMEAESYGFYSRGYVGPGRQIGDTYYDAAAGKWHHGGYWIPFFVSEDPGTRVFKTREDIPVSCFEAITHATPFYNECRASYQFVLLLSAADTLLKPRFDGKHDALSVGLSSANATDIHRSAVIDTKTLVPGDHVYLQNKSDFIQYAQGTPELLSWQGEHLIYAGISADTGLFCGNAVKPCTEDELRAFLQGKYVAACPGHSVEDPTNQIKFTEYHRHITGD
jgi:hypothetical protein